MLEVVHGSRHQITYRKQKHQGHMTTETATRPLVARMFTIVTKVLKCCNFCKIELCFVKCFAV